METNNNNDLPVTQEFINPGIKWEIEAYKAEIARLSRTADERQDDYTNMFSAFMELCGAVEDLFKQMIADEVVTDDLHPYLQFFNKWIETGKIEVDFRHERKFRVQCDITVVYDVSVECNMGDDDADIQGRLEDAFLRGDGDDSQVSDDLGSDIIINDISVWDRDVAVDAQVD